MVSCVSKFNGKRSLRRPEPAKKAVRQCAECGCDTTDYYTQDPATGRPSFSSKLNKYTHKVWCAACYESGSRKAMQDESWSRDELREANVRLYGDERFF
jgi:hypothetical protein